MSNKIYHSQTKNYQSQKDCVDRILIIFFNFSFFFKIKLNCIWIFKKVKSSQKNKLYFLAFPYWNLAQIQFWSFKLKIKKFEFGSYNLKEMKKKNSLLYVRFDFNPLNTLLTYFDP